MLYVPEENKNAEIGAVAEITEKSAVIKSNPLATLNWASDSSVECAKYTLEELKLLDIYLACLFSQDNPSRKVLIPKRMIEHLLGVDRIRTDTLEKYCDKLQQRIKIYDNETKNFDSIVLFERAKVIGEEEKTLILECTPTAQRYVFNPAHYGYLSFALQSVLAIKSSYTYLLYMYLLQNMFRREECDDGWQDSVEKIQRMMNYTCDSNSNFKYFKRDVLAPACKEVQEKTSIKFDYVCVRTGRKVTHIRFVIHSAELLAAKEQYPIATLFTDEQPGPPLLVSHELSSAISALREISGEEFTDEELTVFLEIMRQTPDSKPMEGKGIEWYKSYYNHIVNLATRQMKKKKIEDKFSYLKACFENERDERIKQAKKDAPNGNTEGSDEYDLEKYFTASAKAGSDPELDELLRQAAERKYKMLPDTDDSEQ